MITLPMILTLSTLLFLGGILLVYSGASKKMYVSSKAKRTKPKFAAAGRIFEILIGCIAVLIAIPVIADFPNYINDNCIEGKAIVEYCDTQNVWRVQSRLLRVTLDNGEHVSIRAFCKGIEAKEPIYLKALPLTKYAEINAERDKSWRKPIVILLVGIATFAFVCTEPHFRKKQLCMRQTVFKPDISASIGDAVLKCVFSVIFLVAYPYSCSAFFEGAEIPIVFAVCISINTIICSYFLVISLIEVCHTIKRKKTTVRGSRITEYTDIDDVLLIIKSEDIVDVSFYLNNITVRIGASSDYSNEQGFFDKRYYINDTEYNEYSEFRTKVKELLNDDYPKNIKIE